MQDWKARDQCKRCRNGRYTNFVTDGGWQPIKCGNTDEIKLNFEKCIEYEESLPIIGPNQKHRIMTHTGFSLDLNTFQMVPCVKGRFPDGKKTALMLSDAW